MNGYLSKICFALAIPLETAGLCAQATIQCAPASRTSPSHAILAREEAFANPPLINQTPVDVRPFQFILPKGHLFGDWLGARADLEQMGISPTLTLEIDTAANPTGGRAEGITEAGNLGLSLLFDLDTFAGVNGGSFLLQLSERWGNSLSADYIGNVFTTQQDYGEETLHVVDAAYQQRLFDDRVEFRLGRIAGGDDFLVCPYD
jgi:hypothetical protein